MADIFLSYARKDLARIQFLLKGFESMGLSVWWDAELVPGKDFSKVIEEELTNAKCIVVAWSDTSIKSNWVKSEAQFGMEKNALVPVMINTVKLPIEFSRLHTARFTKWQSANPANEQSKFMEAIRVITKTRKRKPAYKRSKSNYSNSVFLNCSFSAHYKPLFDAAVFTIASCGFQPRTAMDYDGRVSRMEKLLEIIDECKYGIHDISQSKSDYDEFAGLNIPLELGMFLGAQRFDPIAVKGNHSLIVEEEKYSHQRYLSDINGLDTAAHNNDPVALIRIIRNWLSEKSERTNTMSANAIVSNLAKFKKDITNGFGLSGNDRDFISYPDLVSLIVQWLRVDGEDVGA